MANMEELAFPMPASAGEKMSLDVSLIKIPTRATLKALAG